MSKNNLRVGRVSPSGVTRQAQDTPANEDVGLRCANPTYAAERLLSAKGVSKVSSGLLPIGTLLLSSRAPIGYLAIAQIPLAINQGYIAILPSSQLLPLYMYFWCKQNMEVIKSRSNGSTFMEISKKAFRPIPALVPPVELLADFLDVANPIFARLTENEKQAQTLAVLRDTLLPRLISGQLRLPDAEALIEEITA
ncbi:MAG: restriction endonuclease subunit S [Methylobacter sp.]|nr:restriction endonuclease subunit S [Methylobacter sp.]